MPSNRKSSKTHIYLLMFVGLPLLSAFFLILKTLTHYEFLLHVAAIPLEILLGAFLVERFLTRKEKKSKLQQLMYIKSYIFRSEMRNVFINNFDALEHPDITMTKIKNASLVELKSMRDNLNGLRYRSLEALEPVIQEYANSERVFQGFMEWAITNDFEIIFHDMIFLLHFIKDVKLYKRHNPEKLFIQEAERQPKIMEKVQRVLKDGVCKFLDYAIELKEKQPEVFDEILTEYQLSSQMK